MKFLNFPYNLSGIPEIDFIEDCSTESLLQFLLVYYKLSKKELATHLEVNLDRLEELLKDNHPPSTIMKERLVELLK